MNKSTVVLLLLAALGLGSLIGISLVDSEPNEQTPAAVGAAPPTGGAPPLRYLAPGDVPVEIDKFGQPLPSVVGENFIARDREWKTETISFELPADGAIEYKAIMQQGDVAAFRWYTSGGQAYYDFHAHDDAFGPEFFTRYEEGEGTERAGGFVAAYDGEHGWFWLNLEGEPLTITLDLAGFFEEIVRVELEDY